MPIVSGNEPQPPRRRSSGPGLGWIFPLLVFGPVLYNTIRRATAGILTDQQLLIVGGGLVGLVVLGIIAQRVNRIRAGSSSSLPTSYTPPPSVGGSSSLPSAYASQMSPTRTQPGQSYVPRPPKFEPIITGKVLLAGLVVALVLGGIGLLLLPLVGGPTLQP